MKPHVLLFLLTVFFSNLFSMDEPKKHFEVKYNNYSGEAVYCPETKMFRGYIRESNQELGIVFEGNTQQQAANHFIQSIHWYMELKKRVEEYKKNGTIK